MHNTEVSYIHYFDAPYDSLARFLSIFIPAAFIIGTFAIFHLEEEITMSMRILFAGFIIAIIALPYLFSPRSYAMDNTSLTVNFLLWRVKIAYSDIESISFAPDTGFSVYRRLVGSSGYFGYWGIYNLPNIGKVSVLTNTRKPVVFIHRKSKRPIIVGPDKIETFVASLKQKVVLPDYIAATPSAPTPKTRK